MSHVIPPVGHKAREMFDVADLAAIGTGAQPVRCNIWELRRMAKEAIAATPGAKRMVYFRVDSSNDKLQLVSIGARGGWRVEWTFGPITRATKLI